MADGEDPWGPPPTTPVEPLFHIFEARSHGLKDRTIHIEMPSSKYKMMCGSVVAHGHTLVLGSFPATSSRWTATHDPSDRTAYVVLRVIAIVDTAEPPVYETVVRRIAQTTVEGRKDDNGSSSFGGLDVATLASYSGRKVTIHCPIPAKYTLCGGGFYATKPIGASAPVIPGLYGPTSPKQSALTAGGAWSVTADNNAELVAFAVAVRLSKEVAQTTPSIASMARGLAHKPPITIDMDGPVWRGSFPAPHGDFAYTLGSCRLQDPASVALYAIPSAVCKSAISKAPPAMWSLLTGPISDEQRGRSTATYCHSTKR